MLHPVVHTYTVMHTQLQCNVGDCDVTELKNGTVALPNGTQEGSMAMFECNDTEMAIGPHYIVAITITVVIPFHTNSSKHNRFRE